MNKILPIILVVLLSGCATVNIEYGSDGKKMYKYMCDVSWLSSYHDGCPSVLGDTCKEKGYTVLKTRSHHNIFGQEMIRTIFFVCNE